MMDLIRLLRPNQLKFNMCSFSHLLPSFSFFLLLYFNIIQGCKYFSEKNLENGNNLKRTQRSSISYIKIKWSFTCLQSITKSLSNQFFFFSLLINQFASSIAESFKIGHIVIQLKHLIYVYFNWISIQSKRKKAYELI